VKNEGSLAAAVNLVALPLLLLSGIMLPISMAPDILQKIAKVNPFAYSVDAARALVAGHLGDIAIAQAFIILGVLALLALWWATNSIRKAAM
jgi:ABC-2 type transport system permease protein